MTRVPKQAQISARTLILRRVRIGSSDCAKRSRLVGRSVDTRTGGRKRVNTEFGGESTGSVEKALVRVLVGKKEVNVSKI